jgi:hypothetical protein
MNYQDIQFDKSIAIAIEAQKKQLELLKDEDPFKSLIISKAEIVTESAGFNLTEATVGQASFSDDDYIIIKSIFATSQPYVNGNKDSFREEDINSVGESKQLSETKPGILDLNHNFFPFGTVIGKKVSPANINFNGETVEVKHLEVYSVLWAWRFPELAENVRDWNEIGLLRFSMACKAKAHLCGECGVEATNVDEYCEHLKDKTYNERILIEPKFYANSIISPDRQPADSNAKALEIGEFMTVEGENMEKFIVSYDEVYWITRDAMSNTYAALWNQVRDILDANQSVISNIKSVFDEARDSYVMLFKQLQKFISDAGLYEVNLDKKKKRYDLENLPWLLRETLYDIEASGSENSESLIKKAFNDAKNMFVSLWKALEPEQKETFRNQKIIISEQDINLTNKGELEMDQAQRIKELESQLKEAIDKLDEYENTETTKQIEGLKTEVADLKAKLVESDKKIDELETSKQEHTEAIKVLETEKTELTEQLDSQNELVVEARKQEVESTNLARKGKIEEMKLTDEQKEFWINEFQVSLDEETGEIKDPNRDMYEKFVSKLPAEEAIESQKVLESKKNDALHVAEVTETKALSNTVAN